MKDKTLFIENLDHLTTAEHLENIFSAYGDVNKVKVRKDKGFVEMMTSSGANRARMKLDGCNLWGRSMKIWIADNTLRHRMLYMINRLF
jgi:RNA recognition motif-containing protein